MAYKTVEVEVDISLDEFDIDDILSELKYRMKRKTKMNKYDIESAKSICAEILGISEEQNQLTSLMDTMKLELFLSSKDKKTLQDLKTFLIHKTWNIHKENGELGSLEEKMMEKICSLSKPLICISPNSDMALKL